MRVGIVSPYSYTYPGGVGRHVEALSEELGSQGHDVRIMAPYDPDDRLARVMHRGAAPDRRPLPENLISLGRSTGFPANGAVSNLGISSQAVGTLGRELRHGGYDVIHVHEPNAPFVGFFAAEAARVPLVGTYHCYSTEHAGQRLHVERDRGPPPVQQDRRADRRVRGRAVDGRALLRRPLPDRAQRRGSGRRPARPRRRRRARAPVRGPRRRPQGPARAAARLRGAAQRRRGRAPDRGRLHPRGGGAAADGARGHPPGRAREPRRRSGACWAARTCCARPRWAARASAWCSPRRSPRTPRWWPPTSSATATWCATAWTACSCPPRDAAALGEALRSLALDPARRAAMAAAAREGAERFTWPHVAHEVADAYEDAAALPQPGPPGAAARAGSAWPRPTAAPVVRPRRLPSLEPEAPPTRRRRAVRVARRVAVAGAAVAGVGLAGLAVRHIGVDSIGRAIAGRHARVGAGGLRAHVPVDAHARRGVARDPARRAARACASAAATPRGAR